MIDKIEFTETTLGIKAILKGQWSDNYLPLFLEKEVTELELNDAKGWQGDNVDFLVKIPFLKSLIIIDFNIKSIEGIYALKNLVLLELLTYSKKPVNFKFFPNLVECDFEWITGSDSLFEIKSLKKLSLNSYKKKSSDDFVNLVNLEELTILNSSIENLNGLVSLLQLRVLRLGNLKKLNSLTGIEKLVNLEYFEIQKCKGISSISEVLKLINLKHLLLIDIGNIESIKGIENLSHLVDFFFYESTNVNDGDLNPITKLKNLKKISFQNRKHYTHRREDFDLLYR